MVVSGQTHHLERLSPLEEGEEGPLVPPQPQAAQVEDAERQTPLKLPERQACTLKATKVETVSTAIAVAAEEALERPAPTRLDATRQETAMAEMV